MSSLPFPDDMSSPPLPGYMSSPPLLDDTSSPPFQMTCHPHPFFMTCHHSNFQMTCHPCPFWMTFWMTFRINKTCNVSKALLKTHISKNKLQNFLPKHFNETSLTDNVQSNINVWKHASHLHAIWKHAHHPHIICMLSTCHPEACTSSAWANSSA